MMDFLFQTGFSNTCIALALALLALLVGAKSKRPQLAHLLWLLVLVKLVTPPIFNVPVEFPVPQSRYVAGEPITGNPVDPLATRADAAAIEGSLSLAMDGSPVTQWNPGALWTLARPWIGMIWLAGTSLIVLWSLVRVVRFHRLLNQNSRLANRKVLHVARCLGEQLGLRKSPVISTTAARISPMVWWVGGKVRVVLPQSMIDEMKQEQWQWVLAHELSHVRRRDYLVRWLEWFACACFWWNPVVWWAQRNLRATEEICCDDLVLSSLKPGSQSYAESILAAVESLVCPAIRPPAMASEINSGGFLERRMEMILSGTDLKSPRTLQFCIAAFAMLFIPFGIVQAQDFDAVKERLTNAVKHDEISFEQAARMMETLRQSAREDGRRNEWQEKEIHDKDLIDREKKFHAAQAKLEKALASGAITREQFKQKIEGLAQELWPGQWKFDAEVDFTERRQYEDDQTDFKREEALQRALIELDRAVAAGKISGKDAKKKIAGLKEKLWSYGKDKKDETVRRNELEDLRKLKFRDAEVEIKELINAGKITNVQAVERLDELKQKLWSEQGEDKRRPDLGNTAFMLKALEEAQMNDDREKLLQAAERKIKEMIKAEKMTKEKGHEQLEGLKKKLRPDLPRQFLNLGSFVPDGHQLTLDTLGATVRRIELNDRKPQQGKKHKGREKIYRDAEAELVNRVKAGKIDKKQAADRLEGLMKKLSWDEGETSGKRKENPDQDSSPDWDQVKKRIESAVDAGKMTREQANKVYADIKEHLEKRQPDRR